MIAKTYDWCGEFDDSTVMNLKALCYDIESRYTEKQENGKRLFILENLTEEQSMFVVSRIKHYGLLVQPKELGRKLPVAIRMHLEGLDEEQSEAVSQTINFGDLANS